MIAGFTEAELVAIITGTFAVVAGIPAVIAAVITARTRRENRDQHAEGQAKVDSMSEAVGKLHGAIHTGVIPRLDRIDSKLEQTDDRLDNLEGH